MLTLSLVKSIEIVGEAASRVSSAFRETHPEIPWMVIVTMRNRLIHAYFDVDLDRAWDTIIDDLPLLINELKMILSMENGR
jgi:uncharacterized protein with HEPN domain